MPLEVQLNVVGSNTQPSKIWRSFSKTKLKSFNFILPAMAAEGKLTTIAGEAGAGKGSVLINAATRLNNGGVWFDSTTRLNQCSVAWASHEEEVAEELRPRAEVAGNQNLHKLIELDIENIIAQRSLVIEMARDVKDLKLIVLDPIQDFIGEVNINDGGQVRLALRRIGKIAQECKCAIVGLHHLNKSNSGSARGKFLGSQAFISFPRFAWMVVTDPNNPDQRYLQQVKGNMNRIGPAYCFEIEGRPLNIDGKVISVPAAHFSGDTEEIEVDEFFSKERTSIKLEDAEDFIFSNLSESQPIRSDEWEVKYRAAHISKATMRRAETNMSVKSFQRDGVWWKVAQRSGSEGVVTHV